MTRTKRSGRSPWRHWSWGLAVMLGEILAVGTGDQLLAQVGSGGGAGSGARSGGTGAAAGTGVGGRVSPGTTNAPSATKSSATPGSGVTATQALTTQGMLPGGFGAQSAPAGTRQMGSRANIGLARRLGLGAEQPTGETSQTSRVLPSTGILGNTNLAAGGGTAASATPRQNRPSSAAAAGNAAAGAADDAPANGTSAADRRNREGTGMSAGGVGVAGGTDSTLTVPGVAITNVAQGSLAAEVGFQASDQILTVNGQPVESWEQLEQQLLAGSRTDQPVAVRLRRGGEIQTLQLPNQQLAEILAQATQLSDGMPGGAAMGVVLDGSAEARVVVSRVIPGSPALLAGLQPGDEIIAIMDQPLTSPEQVRRAVALAGVGDPLRLTYQRNQRTFEVTVPLTSYASVFGPADLQGVATDRAGGPALGVRVVQDPAGRVVVAAVQTNSPAAMAGIRPGDQIVRAQDRPVASPADLAASVDQAAIGAPFPLTYLRNGQEIQVTPQLGAHTELFAAVPTATIRRPSIGVRLREDVQGGPLVTLVAPNSPAARAGLRPGDHIVAVNGKPVSTSQDVVHELAGAGIGSSVQIQFLRGGRTEQILAPVANYAAVYGQQPGGEREVARPILDQAQGKQAPDLEPNPKATSPQPPPPPQEPTVTSQEPSAQGLSQPHPEASQDQRSNSDQPTPASSGDGQK